MDLVRALLIGVADMPPSTQGLVPQLEVEGRTDEEVQHHLRLLAEAGLMRVHDLGMQGLRPDELTWAGQDAVDAMRDSKVWQAAKDHVLKPLGGASFAFLLDYLKTRAKEVLGLPP